MIDIVTWSGLDICSRLIIKDNCFDLMKYQVIQRK